LVLSDGEVIGVVFSRSTLDPAIGYALTSPDVLPRLAQAEGTVVPVPTGGCAPP